MIFVRALFLFTLLAMGTAAQSDQATPGIKLYDEGKISEAIAVLTAETRSPTGRKNAAVFNALGMAHAKLGTQQHAVKALESAVKLAPRNASYRTNLSYSLIQTGKSRNALKHLDAAIKAEPQNSAAYLLRARAYLETGRYKPAESDYRRFENGAPLHAIGALIKAEVQYLLARQQMVGPRNGFQFLDAAVQSLEVGATLCSAPTECAVVNYRLIPLRRIREQFEKELVRLSNPSDPPIYDPEPDVTPLTILTKPRASYNDRARRNGIVGTVALIAFFGESGIVEFAVPINKIGYGLDEAAFEALSKLRFEPRRRIGVPEGVVRRVEYNFLLY